MHILYPLRCILLCVLVSNSFGTISGGAFNIDLDSPVMLGSFDFGEDGMCLVRILEAENPKDSEKLTFLLMALDAEHAKKAEICEASITRAFVPGISWISVNETTEVPKGGGLYELFYVGYPGCPLVEPSSVKVHVEFYSVIDGKKNYLQMGDMPLPTVYFGFSLLYMALVGMWLRRLRQYNSYINKIHYLMAFLIVVKCGAIVTDCMKLSAFNQSGTGSAWDIFYYTFIMLKGVMMFALFLLIGAGWSIFRPMLSSIDRKVFVIVIPIIVVVNILNIYIEEYHPNPEQLSTLSTVLQITEYISGLLVLTSVTKNTTGLHNQEQRVGKKPSSRRRRLQVFALVVVAYLYIRTGLLLLLRSLPRHLSFVRPAVTELFVAILYTVVGFTFRPTDQKELDLSVLNSDDETDDCQPVLVESRSSSSPRKNDPTTVIHESI